MYKLILLLYMLSMFVIVAAFSIHLTVRAKNLTAASALAKQNTTTAALTLIFIFNLCDFLIIYFSKEGISHPVPWIFVVENILEIGIAYAVMAMSREYIKKDIPRVIDIVFVVDAMLVLFSDAWFTLEKGMLGEVEYAITMVLLNLIPIIVLLCYAVSFAKAHKETGEGKGLKYSVLIYNLFCIFLCSSITLNTIDSRTKYDFFENDEIYYVALMLAFNVFSFFFVWKTLNVDERTETERIQTPEEKIEYITERYGLSAREREIAVLLFEGKNNKEIAAMLFLSPNTVKVHASNLYHKLGASNRVQAVQVLRGESVFEPQSEE